MAKITFILDDGQELVLPISGRVSIGRAESNDVVVDDKRMSNHHAELLLHVDGSVEVFDLKSTAGTSVNDQNIIRQVLLHGDRVAFGPLTGNFDMEGAVIDGTTTAALHEQKTAIEVLKTQLEQKAAEVEKLTAEVVEEKAKLDSIRRDCAKAEATQRERQTSIDALDLQHEQKSAALAKLTKELEQTQTRQVEENSRLEAVRLELAQLEKRTLESQTEAARQKEQAHAAAVLLTLQHDKKATALVQLSDDVEIAQARLDAIHSRQAEENKRLDALRREAGELEALTARKQVQVRDVEASLALLQLAATQAEATRVKQQASMEALTQEQEKKAAALRQVTEEASEAQSRLETLVSRQTEETSRIEKLQATVSQENIRLTAVRQELAQVEIRIQESQNVVTKCQEQARTAEEALKQVEKRQQEAEAEVQELDSVQERLSEAKSACAETEKLRDTLNSSNVSLIDELEKKKEALKKLQTQIAAAEDQLATVHKRLSEQTSLLIGQDDADSPLSSAPTIQVKSTRSKIFLRCFMIALPLTLLAVAGWAAEQSRRGRLVQNQGVVGMLAEPMPALHPYAPRTEAERQIIDLVHEPLMRIGTDGTLQPALAELWRWSQDVTCWFADAETAKRAQESLQPQIGEKNLWAEWHLSTVRILGSSLVLNFSDPTRAGTPQALAVIAPFQPQVISFWRVETDKPLKAAAEQFLAQSLLASQIRRTWFDHENAFEIVTVGPAQKVIDELRGFLHQQTQAEIRVRLFGEVAALSEPVLDLDLRHGQTWHDGTLVTAEDVKTTIEQVNQRPWLLPNREALRHIQQMEIQNEGHRLRVIFRSRYGPALCGWAGLPVLPASWWREHAITDDTTFARHPPPGAGPYRVGKPDARTLILTPTTATQATSFLFHFGASPLMTQIGLGTHTTQLAWPAATPENQYGMRTCLTPPHRRRVVLWNTRSGALADPRVRQATAMSTDVAAIIAAIPGRHSISDASLFPPGMWLHTQAARPTYALTEAKKLLSNAGWLIGVDGVARNAERRLEFTLLLVGGDPSSQITAKLLASQWQQLGIKLTVETLAKPDLLAQRLAERRFDAALLEQQFEVSWDQFPWWHSSQAKPGGTNYAGIQDPQTDLLLEALSTEFEPAAAAARVREVEARLLPLHPMLTLFDTVDDTAVQEDLIGKQPRSAWTLRQLALQPKKSSKGPQIDLKLPDE